MTNYAILATTQHEDYSFYVPITARFWRKMGYTAAVWLYGMAEDWTRGQDRVMLGALSVAGARYGYLGNINGCSKALAAKLSRWCAASHHIFRPDDYLVMSDADLWPLDAEWFKPSAAAWTFWNSDVHGSEHYHSACFIGAKAGQWRRAMVDTQTVQSDVQRLVEWEARREPDWAGWRSDEQFMRDKVPAFPDYDKAQHKSADLTKRIDRAEWPRHPKAEGMRDAHLPRPGTDDAVWRAVRPLVEQVIPEYRAAIEAYRNSYLEAMQG